MLIVDHMARRENPEAEAPPNVVLARLLEEILDREFADRASDLATAGELLTATSEAIERELCLVTPGTPASQTRRRRRGGRRRRG